MAIQRNGAKNSSWPIFGIGVTVTAVGGSLLTAVGLRFLNQAIRGNPPESIGVFTVLTTISGICLLSGGFLAMTLSAIHPEGEAESVSSDFPNFHQQADLPAENSAQSFGPPTPLVVIRCQRCKTLNNEHSGTCIRCDQLL
jgi:hypothetical protein